MTKHFAHFKDKHSFLHPVLLLPVSFSQLIEFGFCIIYSISFHKEKQEEYSRQELEEEKDLRSKEIPTFYHMNTETLFTYPGLPREIAKEHKSEKT